MFKRRKTSLFSTDIEEECECSSDSSEPCYLANAKYCIACEEFCCSGIVDSIGETIDVPGTAWESLRNLFIARTKERASPFYKEKLPMDLFKLIYDLCAKCHPKILCIECFGAGYRFCCICKTFLTSDRTTFSCKACSSRCCEACVFVRCMEYLSGKGPHKNKAEWELGMLCNKCSFNWDICGVCFSAKQHKDLRKMQRRSDQIRHETICSDCESDKNPFKGFKAWALNYWEKQSQLDFVNRDSASDFLMDAIQDSGMPWNSSPTTILMYLQRKNAVEGCKRCFKECWDYFLKDNGNHSI